MSTRVMPSVRTLKERPAWKALEKHYDELRGKHLRELFASDQTRGERLVAEAAGLYLDYSKNRITEETVGLLAALAEQSGLADRIEAMFTGERINVSEDRSVLHVALRMPKTRLVDRRRRRRGQAGARGARPDGGVLGPRPRRGLARSHRPADPERGQHRDRRLGPRAGDGIRGAAPLHRPRDDVPVRLERRLDGHRRGDPRPGSGGDAVHRLLEDVHDARDDDQRAVRARLDAGRAQGRGGDRQAFRGRLDERREGDGVRDRHRQHVRVLGVGRWPLLDGLGDRALDDARGRPGGLPRDAGRLPRARRALPQHPVRGRTCRC